MKKVFWICILLTSVQAFAQMTARDKEVMKIVVEQDSIPRSVFLDTSVMENVMLSVSENYKQVWNDIDDSIKSINQFFDLRVMFDSDSAALAFHQEYWRENSEQTTQIKQKKHKIKIEDIDDLMVFKQEGVMADMFLKPYGFQAYCFLFVVHNFAVKFYVTCNDSYQPSFFTKHIESARDRIRDLPKN